MNGNSNDTSNTYNGTPTNITYQGGAFDQAAVFNGSSSLIKDVLGSGFTYAGKTMTFSAWIFVTDNTNDNVIIGDGFTTSQGGWAIATGYGNAPNQRLSFSVASSAMGGVQQTYSSVSIADDTWTHIAVSVDFSSVTDSIKMYINGTEDTSLTDGISGSFVENTTYNSSIGGTWTGVAARLFEGSIDQVRIFNTALTQAQVTTLARGIATSYSGANTNVNFNGHLDFQPDLVWTKCRSDAYDHNWVDSVRGINPNGTLYALSSNLTGAQTDSTNNVLSLDANGFTVQGTGSRTNAIGRDYVSWAWKAGGAAVSNTAGTITSQVSANKDAGFSIVKYTGNNTDGATVGTGLNQACNIVIVKDLTSANYWCVGGSTVGDGENLYLNDASQRQTRDRVKSVQTNTFTLGSHFEVNSTNDFIAYCFHSVSGYSSIGSYSGTGSSNNVITGLGFQPNWLMVKRTDASGGSWLIVDNRRVESSGNLSELFANTTSAETTGYDIDFTSDGFTLNTTTVNANASGTNNYIYMAIA